MLLGGKYKVDPETGPKFSAVATFILPGNFCFTDHIVIQNATELGLTTPLYLIDNSNFISIVISRWSIRFESYNL